MMTFSTKRQSAPSAPFGVMAVRCRTKWGKEPNCKNLHVCCSRRRWHSRSVATKITRDRFWQANLIRDARTRCPEGDADKFFNSTQTR